MTHSSYFLVGSITVFLISSYHKTFLRALGGRKSMFFPTLFLFSGRKIVPIPAHFLPSKICWVGSSQLLRPISYHEVGSIAVSLISSYRKFVGNPLRGLPYGEEKCSKNGMSASPAGRRSVQKRHGCLPCGDYPTGRRSVQKRHVCLPSGEEKCSKKGMSASPAGRRSVQKRHGCLPCGEEKCSKKA